ncbi:MAG: hypothetical protein K0R28_5688 [Paenibacillus sp.]|jgi:hypothetical protein|nr:hypothetical protein [Paenibacillus sp.]
MHAINEDREPTIGGRDNLNTLQTLQAMIASSEKRTVIELGLLER